MYIIIHAHTIQGVSKMDVVTLVHDLRYHLKLCFSTEDYKLWVALHF